MGSGVSKTVHFDQSEYNFGTSLIHFRVVIFGIFDLIFGNSLSISARRMFYSGVDIFGSSFNINKLTSPSETVHVDLARCTDLNALLNTFEHRVICA